jgi:DNA-binding CsgD family transcriptional regulator
MTMTFGYAESRGGARICYTTASGHGIPILYVLNAFYPCGSVLSHYSGALRLHTGLAEGASWYMFDWRGAGKSTAQPGPVTFTDLVDDVEAVARAIGESFDVAAVNDGCGLALGLAARHPEMVRRMLLIAPQGEEALRPELAARTRRLADADPVGALAQYLMWVHPGTDPDETYQIAMQARLSKPLEVVRAHREAAVDVDLLSLASSVCAPTFLISTGEQVQDALALAAAMPFAWVANWTEIGDGTINGAAWRQAWDEVIPPGALGVPATSASRQLASLPLSHRETEILALVCRGLSNAEIADSLVIATSTAKRHVANIFEKLGVSSRPQAIAMAYERGLAPAPTRRE